MRSRRLEIDGYKCQRCGSAFRLQVHHIRYDINLGMENPYTDLITLCENCHEEIEAEKRRQKEDVRSYWDSQKERWEREKAERLERQRRHKALIRQFIEECKDDDLSNLGKGKYNYCNLDIIKERFYPWMRAHGAEEFEDGYIAGVADVQEYFRNRKYEIILDMMEKGCPAQVIYDTTNFSRSMIDKVIRNPEQARILLKKEREETNNA